MRKFVFGIILVALAICLLTSCCIMMDDSSSETTGEKGSVVTEESQTNLGEYKIIIDSCRLAIPEYSDSTIVIVKYIFTNYSDDAVSFGVAFDETVYQDGIGLNEYYFSIDSANYTPDNQHKEIKPGATLEVEVAYELNDTTTDIEVEVKEYFSWNDQVVSKIFSIK